MGHDLRKYARQTNFRLIAGGLLLLFVVGLGLIYWTYGAGAAVVGLLCMLGGLLPIVLVVLIFWVMDQIIKHADPK